jgi:hypothetical protein
MCSCCGRQDAGAARHTDVLMLREAGCRSSEAHGCAHAAGGRMPEQRGTWMCSGCARQDAWPRRPMLVLRLRGRCRSRGGSWVCACCGRHDAAAVEAITSAHAAQGTMSAAAVVHEAAVAAAHDPSDGAAGGGIAARQSAGAALPRAFSATSLLLPEPSGRRECSTPAWPAGVRTPAPRPGSRLQG